MLTSHFLSIWLVLAVALGMAQPSDWEAVYHAAGLSPDIKPNTLSDSEGELGWELLFDGDTLRAPWRGYQMGYLPSGWIAHEEALHRASGGGDIVFEKEYDNFVWAIEWKVSLGGNSGLFYRADESTPKMYMNALEMQVLDNDNYPGDQLPTRMAGAAYDLYAPNVNGEVGYDATFRVNGMPDGYNKVLIVVFGNHHEYWLNGIKVVSFEADSEDWKRRKSESKFKDYYSFATKKAGYFGLQDHTNPIWFRNIKVRRLSESPDAREVWPNQVEVSLKGMFKNVESGKWAVTKLSRNHNNRVFNDENGRDPIQVYGMNGKLCSRFSSGRYVVRLDIMEGVAF